MQLNTFFFIACGTELVEHQPTLAHQLHTEKCIVPLTCIYVISKLVFLLKKNRTFTYSCKYGNHVRQTGNNSKGHSFWRLPALLLCVFLYTSLLKCIHIIVYICINDVINFLYLLTLNRHFTMTLNSFFIACGSDLIEYQHHISSRAPYSITKPNVYTYIYLCTYLHISINDTVSLLVKAR